VFAFTSNLFAESADDSKTSYKDQALQKGAWAFQLGVDEGLTLGTISGVDILVKRHISPRRAYRFGLDDLYVSTDNIYDERDASNNNRYNKYQIYKAYIQFQKIEYFDLDASVQMYYAIGLRGGMRYSSQEFNNSSNSGITKQNNATRSMRFDFISNLGMEYFITDNVSFIAEYEVIIGYEQNRSTHSITERSYRTYSSSAFLIEAYSAELGLSIYLK